MRSLGSLCVILGLWSAAAGPPVIPNLKLLHYKDVPAFGLGVYMVPPGQETYNTVKSALELGYRMVDTAMMYKNEESVGQAVNDFMKEAGVKREDLWIQSKLETAQHGYDNTIKSVKRSIALMDLTYLDCYLIHSPFGGKLIETYDALLQLQKEGLVKSVGVSNYDVRHLEKLEEHGRPLPVMNQIEMHPMILKERQKLVDYHKKKGIIVQAYGSIFFGKTEHLESPIVKKVQAKHPEKSVAQVLLRWALQKGFQLIPKSVKKKRLEENMNIFDFELTAHDMVSLDSMQGSLDAYWNPVKDAGVDLGETTKYKLDDYKHMEL